MATLTVLHTSDWHLGHQLYRKRRDQEFALFLDWLSDTLKKNHVDALIIAGDVFDTGSPGTTAQSQYYEFLAKIGGLGVRHVVIVGGNHDSPAFLSASAPVLKNLNIHITGSATESIRDEILVLRDRDGNPELLVCAAPFLREGDICRYIAGESAETRSARLMDGLKSHFETLAKEAEEIRSQLDRDVPVIATAHLFTADIDPHGESSVREIYRGNLGCVPLNFFPETFDYVALGHIHRPYAVGGNPSRRYSGSPIPLTFAEAKYDKELLLIRWEDRKAEISSLSVPRFRKMLSVEGNSREILARLALLVAENSGSEDEIWLEINHDGSDSPAGLLDDCQNVINGAKMEILGVNTASREKSNESLDLEHGLDELKPVDMFRRCLTRQNVPEEEWSELEEDFMELLLLVQNGGDECES